MDGRAHRARRLDAALMGASDLVLTMTRHQAQILRGAWPDFAGQMMSLGELTGGSDIADPWGGDRRRYRHVAQALERAFDALVERLRDWDEPQN